MTDIVLDIQEILSRLPHRYPFLLVDRVLEIEPGKRIKALKNVTYNEPFFTGHFPQKPVMPGMLILEAMAQASALLAFKSFEIADISQKLFYFTSVDKARFRCPVVPGDQLFLDVSFDRARAGMFKSIGKAYAGNKLAVEATVMCAMREEAL